MAVNGNTELRFHDSAIIYGSKLLNNVTSTCVDPEKLPLLYVCCSAANKAVL